MCELAPNSVLLVDDDPSVRALLSRQLKKEGFETREAEDGIEGLVKLRNELPGVIISDLQMPRMSGFEFVSVVRRRFPCITVIVLSGSIPNDIPEESEPDVWFEKGALNFPNTPAAPPGFGSNNARASGPSASSDPYSNTGRLCRLFHR